MGSARPLVVVADSSVLVNFLRVNRLDLIAAYSCDFIVTDHVADEITGYPEQQKRFEAAQKDGTIRQVRVAHPAEIELFARLDNGRLGAGERSAIAYAVRRRHLLAMDDQRATNHARLVCPELTILTTQDLVIGMISEGLLDIAEADAIKEEWARKHRFNLNIGSFAEIIQSGRQ